MGDVPEGRVKVLVSTIVKRLIRDVNLPQDGARLVADLLNDGYTSDEIEQAFSYLFTLPKHRSAETRLKKPAEACLSRVLTESEKAKISLEGQGLVFALLACGLVKPAELEEILMGAMHLEVAVVGPRELRWLIGNVVQDKERLVLIAGGGDMLSDRGLRKGHVVN